MLTEHPNFVRINRSEIVNLNAIDGFEGNCYYIGKNPLYATGVYRQRMEFDVVVKATQCGKTQYVKLHVTKSDTTGITGIDATETSGSKTYYNLSGQKVEKPLKSGIYIVNGQKVYVK